MALGMLCQVDEKTANCGGPTVSAYLSGVAQSSGTEGSNSFDTFLEGCLEFREEFASRRIAIEFGFQRGKLLYCEDSSFRVGEQAVHAAGDVPDMERKGSDFERPGIELVVTQRIAPAFNIFSCQL